MAIVKITGNDGDGGRASLSFDDANMAGSGGMKDVYFSPCKKYVVGFYKKPQDYSGKERVKKIVGDYRKNIFGGPNGSYWEDYFCWPTHWVEHNGKFGVVAPTYQKHFFFKVGSKKNDMLGIKGKEKQGKWFASASHQKMYLATEERGEWINYIELCIRIARATKRMHAEGLAHSDLSYKNCLVAPTDGRACLIDIDGLVVPGKFPPDVVGTPGFIAPEVVATLNLPRKDPNRALPNRKTDLHALAVLIYNYLLYRHPLEGRKVHDPQDTVRDVELQMGKKALFVDHPTDKSNKPNPADCRKESKPFCDVDKIPYTITGPYLKELFDRAFIDGLHSPSKRPSASEWETALIKTVDLLQRCANPKCDQKWFVFANTSKPKCPFCQTAYKKPLPVLDFYYRRSPSDTFRSKKHRLMVYHGMGLYPWHLNSQVVPGEKLKPNQKKRVGYFLFHQNIWKLKNENIPGLAEYTNDGSPPKKQGIGKVVELTQGQKLMLDPGNNGQLVHVTLVNV